MGRCGRDFVGGLSLEYVMYFLFLPNESFECHSRNVSVFRYAILAFFCFITLSRSERSDSVLMCPFNPFIPCINIRSGHLETEWKSLELDVKIPQ